MGKGDLQCCWRTREKKKSLLEFYQEVEALVNQFQIHSKAQKYLLAQ